MWTSHPEEPRLQKTEKVSTSWSMFIWEILLVSRSADRLGLFLGWVLVFCSSCGCGLRRLLSGIFSPVCRGYRAQPSDHKPAKLRASLHQSLLKVITHVTWPFRFHNPCCDLILAKETRCSLSVPYWSVELNQRSARGRLHKLLTFVLQVSHTFFFFRTGATKHC